MTTILHALRDDHDLQRRLIAELVEKTELAGSYRDDMRHARREAHQG